MLATGVLVVGTLVVWPTGEGRNGSATLLRVFSTPNCACWHKWAEHMRQAGFAVTVTPTRELDDIRRRYGVEDQFAACHTAVVGGYVVEGHVPADLARRLLAERPEVTGLAVPGMPVGSPGIELGDETEPYDVLVFGSQSEPTVYADR